MPSITPPGHSGNGTPPSKFGDSIPPVQGPLLPAASEFVKAVTAMFNKIGMGGNPEEMRTVATLLLQSIQKSIGNQISRETQLSRQHRREDLRELTGDS
jgi:hypothetical protein